jgi:mycothiol synthase
VSFPWRLNEEERSMIDHGIDLPDAPTIPGLVFRAFDPENDYPALVELIREANLADSVEYLPTVENLRIDHENGGEFDPRRDVILAEVGDELVAAADTTVRSRDGTAVHEVQGWVRPAWRRRGLGGALLRWTERRASEVARVDGRSGPRAVSSWPDEGQAGAVALYRNTGYEVVRYAFQMVRDLTEPIPDAPLPDGLEIRPVLPEDHRRIWDADSEAFRDHWNHGERTEADYGFWFAIPELDTSLWRVAWDGAEVAGSVMPFVWAEENKVLGLRRGWLEHVSVRRPWRNRGLASALIAESLRALRDAGLGDAALGVDAENVSGALRVYERMGFRRARTSLSFRKSFTVE